MTGIASSRFHKTVNGKKVDLFTIKNDKGLCAQITNFGARIVSLYTPDRQGAIGDIVLGYDCIDDYLRTENIYFGATIGRYGNRIAKSQFTIENRSYTLNANDEQNCLHGGENGFHNVVWEVKYRSEDHLVLTYYSKNGDQGFPGNLLVSVSFKLSNTNQLVISYEGETDQTTVVNVTHHSYFNLCDGGRTSIKNHILQIKSSKYLPTGKDLIPTGAQEAVSNTPFDFRNGMPMGNLIDQEDIQLLYGGGYDHTYVLDGQELRTVAKVIEPQSGRYMKVITDEPGMQFYSGNSIHGTIKGKQGITYGNRHGFCLETQHFPDSPNQSYFPSTILRPGQIYTSQCIYGFGTL